MDRIKLLKILELDSKAQAEDIERAYMELVKVWHPDRFQNDKNLREKAEEKTRQINQAYQALTKTKFKFKEPFASEPVTSEPVTSESFASEPIVEETIKVRKKRSSVVPIVVLVLLSTILYVGSKKQKKTTSYEQNEFFSLKRQVSNSAKRKNQVKLEEGLETIKTPFIKVITECDYVNFETMLAGGSNIEERDAKGNTALIWAARRGCLEIAKTLIERGVNVNQKSLNGFSPLMWANLYNRKEIEEILIKAGSEPLPKYWDR